MSKTTTPSGIHYWTYHDTDQPTIVMVHGFTGSHEGFQYIIPKLSNFHIIVPDLPGFGKSPLWQREEGSWSIDELARRTNEFVAELNLASPPFLLAHSMGGLVAASMLSQNPELFHKKAILMSPVASKVGVLDSRKFGALLGAAQYKLGAKVPKLVTSKTVSKVATQLIKTTRNRQLSRTIRNHHITNLSFISSIDFYYQLHKDINKKGALDYAHKLQDFEILIITGDRDNVTPLRTEKHLAHAINAKLEVVPSVGHLIHYEKPREAAAAIRAFLYQQG